MNQKLDLSWRKGVTLLLLCALTLSLAVTPSVFAQEEGATEPSSTSEPSTDSSDAVADGEEGSDEATESSNTETDAEKVSESEELSDEATEMSLESETVQEEAVSESESPESIESVESSTEESGTENDVLSANATTTADGETSGEETDSLATDHNSGSAGFSSVATSTEDFEGNGGGSNHNETVQNTAAKNTSIAATSSNADSNEALIPAPVVELTGSSTAIEATSTTVAGSSTAPIASTTASTSTTTIESGTAVALANIINIVNSNFINSDGVVFFSNFLETISDTLDLRRLYETISSFGCSLTKCDQNGVTLNISNNALIENFLVLQALTGGNTIAGGATNGVINTGDAYAGVNLINVANMNFVDSNYLLVTLNAFNDVNGDIIFPSTDLLLSSLAYSPENANISLMGNATVNNDLTLDANSGTNGLSTTNGGTIATGATGATSNVFNQLNSSLIGGQNITIMFRIHGDWAGEVFGAPDDLLWTQSPDGSILLFDSSSGSGSRNSGGLNLTATNNATINNNINVVALTGENQITGTETGLISTGNAYAGANIVNLANGNVVGRNWIMAVINIFGDFKGNIAFGRPDLWVGEMIDAPSKIQNGSILEYKFTVINNGDSAATEVVLEDRYESAYLQIKQASHAYTTTSDGKLRFQLGKIPRGGAVEVSYQAEVTGTAEGQALTNTVTVKGRETDNNVSDNTDSATVKTYKAGGKKKREIVREIKEVPLLAGVMSDEAATLRVKRAFPSFPLTSEFPSMRQVVVLHNPTSTTIPAVTFEDILKDPQGIVVKTEVWELGDVLPGEEIELGYTLAFDQNAPPGTYTLHSRISTSAGAADEHQNGSIIFSTGLIPELLPSFLNDLNVSAPRLTSVPTYFASSHTDTDMDSLENVTHLFDEVGINLPALAAMSTATRQQDGWGNLSMWLNKLYAYLSTLVSKVAPTIALAWGGGREL